MPRFDPKDVQICESPAGAVTSPAGDDRDGRIYVYHDARIKLAVEVALAVGRPLLVRGPSGCGKSSLALNVALTKQWRYYEAVVTARTEARDLLWHYDSVRRLADAHVNKLKHDSAYIKPGVLWWAFDPDGASRRGQETSDAGPPESNSNRGIVGASGAVVLIDEIDKAEVDLPNNLLVPLGCCEFGVEMLDIKPVAAKTPDALLIVITTNGERELPDAFLRRCVTLDLQPPNEKRLVDIAKAHLKGGLRAEKLKAKSLMPPDKKLQAMLESLAKRLLELQGEAKSLGIPGPSTAEYLDTVHACLELGIGPSDPTDGRYKSLESLTLCKAARGEEGQTCTGAP